MRSGQYTQWGNSSVGRNTNTLWRPEWRKPSARCRNRSEKPTFSIEIRAAQVNMTRYSMPFGHLILLAARGESPFRRGS